MSPSCALALERDCVRVCCLWIMETRQLNSLADQRLQGMVKCLLPVLCTCAGHAWDANRGLLTWQVCAFDMAHWWLPLLGMAGGVAGGEVKRRPPPGEAGGAVAAADPRPGVSVPASFTISPGLLTETDRGWPEKRGCCDPRWL
jgi:hypothetical protein